MSKIQSAYEKAVDYTLGLLFKLWLWIGAFLDVRIEVPTVLVPTTSLESVRELEDLREENEALRQEAVAYANHIANGDHIKGDNRPNRKKLTPAEVANIRDLKRVGYS